MGWMNGLEYFLLLCVLLLMIGIAYSSYYMDKQNYYIINVWRQYRHKGLVLLS